MNLAEIPPFRKDFKRLLKKYRTLDEDLAVVRQILEVMPDERPPFSYRIENLGFETCLIKFRKTACKALKGRGVHSSLGLIYGHLCS